MSVSEAVVQAQTLGRSRAERAMVAALLAAGAQPVDIERSLNVMRCAAADHMTDEHLCRLARAIATALMEMRGLDGFSPMPGGCTRPADRAWLLALTAGPVN